MKSKYLLLILLAIFGISLIIFLNFPKETIKIVEVPPTYLQGVVIP